MKPNTSKSSREARPAARAGDSWQTAQHLFTSIVGVGPSADLPRHSRESKAPTGPHIHAAKPLLSYFRHSLRTQGRTCLAQTGGCC